MKALLGRLLRRKETSFPTDMLNQHPSGNAVKTQMNLSRSWREGEDPGVTFMFLNSLLTDLFPATPGPQGRELLV